MKTSRHKTDRRPLRITTVRRTAWNKAIRVILDERPYGLAEHHVRSIVLALEAARDRDLRTRPRPSALNPPS